jgi:hypothetical protein
VVFLGPRANALHASHAALPMVTLNISPYTNVTFTFDFDFGLDHPVHGGYGSGSPTPRRRSNCQTKKLKSGHRPHWGARYEEELADRPQASYSEGDYLSVATFPIVTVKCHHFWNFLTAHRT